MYLDFPTVAQAAAPKSPSGWERFLDLLSTPGASAFGVILAAVLTGMVTLNIAKKQRLASDKAADRQAEAAKEAADRQAEAAKEAADRQIEAAKEAAESARQAASADADKAWARQLETFDKQQQHQREMFERSMNEDRRRAEELRDAEVANEVRRRAVDHAENLLEPLEHLVHPEGLLYTETRASSALYKVDRELSRMQRDIKYLPEEVQRSFDALSKVVRLLELEIAEPAPTARVPNIDNVKTVLDKMVREVTDSVMAFVRNQDLPAETFLQKMARNKLQERRNADVERELQEWQDRYKK